MRPCLENAVLGTMNTVVGWSLLATEDKWGKEEKKNTKPGPSPPLHPYGAAHNINETLNQCGCGDSLSPAFQVTTSPEHSPRERREEAATTQI